MIQLESISRELSKEIITELDRIGIFYRIFNRPKSLSSTSKKIESKNYNKDGVKLQDSIGIRVILYFPDDISLVKMILSKLYLLNNKEEDPFDCETFKPQRTNYVYNLSERFINEHISITNGYGFDCIDTTFEVQIRTVFSEGWHEVDHDLRYKCKDDWKNIPEYSRALNGIYATLETSEWSISKLFDSISFIHYQSKNWNAMVRNKFRLRFSHESLSDKLVLLLNSNGMISKEIFKCNRTTFIENLYRERVRIPITLSNIIYLLNHYELHLPDLDKITPSELLEIIEESY